MTVFNISHFDSLNIAGRGRTLAVNILLNEVEGIAVGDVAILKNEENFFKITYVRPFRNTFGFSNHIELEITEIQTLETI